MPAGEKAPESSGNNSFFPSRVSLLKLVVVVALKDSGVL